MGRGDLEEREKRAFLKSITKSSTSPEDAAHTRGVALVLVLFVLFAAADGALVWYAGWDALNRGTGYLLVVEIALMGGAYKLAARKRR